MKKKVTAFCCALILLAGAALPWGAALENEAGKASDALTLLELTQGIFDEARTLNRAATRAQGAALLVRLAGKEAEAALDTWDSGFQDISGWASTAISYANHQGWAGGVSQDRFAPDGGLSANAWFAFLLRALGYSDQDGDFEVAEAVLFAQHIGLALREYQGYLTQGQLALSALDALSFPYRGGSETMIQRLIAVNPEVQTAANALGLLDTSLTARQAADRLMPAVFQLDVYYTKKAIEKEEPSANASGFFISADGIAVTNYHSIEGAIYGTATLSTGEVYEIERVLYYDEDQDLAALRISQTSVQGKAASSFKYLDMAGTQGAHAGDPVYTLGNPLGLGLAVSAGIISATDRVVDHYSLPCVMNTADISRGSSGGALLNVQGQVIAVTSGAYSYGNSMYLAVPVDPIMAADLTVTGWTLAEVAELENVLEK